MTTFGFTKRLLLSIASIAAGSVLFRAGAQQIALSTELSGYADYGTMSAEISCSVSRHWSASAGVRYNPFLYGGGEDGSGVSNRQRAFSAGGRYWLWHVYSGWWFGGKLQYQEYNRGGISSPRTREGDRIGAGLAAGFTYMISKHFNLEVSAGAWGGYDSYRVYDCPVCGLTVEDGQGFFILPHDLALSLSYLF